MHRFLITWLLAGVLLAGGGAATAADDSKTVLVFGAASLTNVLDDLAKAFTEKSRVQGEVLARRQFRVGPADRVRSAG